MASEEVIERAGRVLVHEDPVEHEPVERAHVLRLAEAVTTWAPTLVSAPRPDAGP